MVNSISLGLIGNLDFPDFLYKTFYNIKYWTQSFKDIFHNFAFLFVGLPNIFVQLNEHSKKIC